MDTILIRNFHSLFFLVPLLILFLATLSFFYGYMKNISWSKVHSFLLRATPIVIDLQVTTGILLFAFTPAFRSVFSQFSLYFQDPTLRKNLILHPILMLTVLILAHVGKVSASIAKDDQNKFYKAMLYYGICLLLVLIGNPYWSL